MRRDGDLVGYDDWGGPDYLGGSPLEFIPFCIAEAEIGEPISCLTCKYRKECCPEVNEP